MSSGSDEAYTSQERSFKAIVKYVSIFLVVSAFALLCILGPTRRAVEEMSDAKNHGSRANSVEHDIDDRLRKFEIAHRSRVRKMASRDLSKRQAMIERFNVMTGKNITHLLSNLNVSSDEAITRHEDAPAGGGNDGGAAANGAAGGAAAADPVTDDNGPPADLDEDPGPGPFEYAYGRGRCGLSVDQQVFNFADAMTALEGARYSCDSNKT
jgi:hypothetical protein